MFSNKSIFGAFTILVLIMAEYANNQMVEQTEVQNPTNSQKFKYETAVIIDQVGAESLFV